MDWPSHLDYRVDDTRRILLIGEAAHGFFVSFTRLMFFVGKLTSGRVQDWRSTRCSSGC